MVVRATRPAASAAASASASSSNFARLMASSRLASHTPVVPQVYTASDAHLGRGDFGVKRPLPSRNAPVGTLRYLEIDAVDTSEGQTTWTEREHAVLLRKRFRELNVPMGPRERLAQGFHGPRISTTYDLSTRRALPSTYAAVGDNDLRTSLQSDARRGVGPLYRDEIGVGSQAAKLDLDTHGPFGRQSHTYTHALPMPIDYQSMDEKKFERFLEFVRQQRPNFQKHVSERTALQVRRKLVQQFNLREQEATRTRNTNAQKNATAAGATSGSTGAAKSQAKLITENDIPLPNKLSQSNADLWNECRIESHSFDPWTPWLNEKNDQRMAQASSTLLPPEPSPSRSVRNAPLHPHGGIQYGQADEIQTRLFNEPVQARALERGQNVQTNTRGYGARSNFGIVKGTSIAVAGRVTLLPHKGSGASSSALNQPLTDWTQSKPDEGIVKVRPTMAQYITTTGTSKDLTPLPYWGGVKRSDLNRSAKASDHAVEALKATSTPDDPSDASESENLSRQYGLMFLDVEEHKDSSETSGLAVGRPGSAQWIGELDARLGHKSGEDRSGPLDYTNLGSIAGGVREVLRSGRGVANNMYSKNDRRRVRLQQQQKQQQQPSAESDSKTSMNILTDKYVKNASNASQSGRRRSTTDSAKAGSSQQRPGSSQQDNK